AGFPIRSPPRWGWARCDRLRRRPRCRPSGFSDAPCPCGGRRRRPAWPRRYPRFRRMPGSRRAEPARCAVRRFRRRHRPRRRRLSWLFSSFGYVADLALVGIRITRRGRLALAILVEHDGAARRVGGALAARLHQVGGILGEDGEVVLLRAAEIP